MVCNRCNMMVRSELESFGLHPVTVELGIAEVERKLSAEEKDLLNERLENLGFELIDDKKTRLVDSIKTTVVDLIHNSVYLPKVTLSEYLSEKLHHDYSALSKHFSEVENVTIEQYVISQKIEKVKELLVYDELSLSEIALELNYSSVSYLSKQFKKVTGLTPSQFKQVKEKKRTPLDKL